MNINIDNMKLKLYYIIIMWGSKYSLKIMSKLNLIDLEQIEKIEEYEIRLKFILLIDIIQSLKFI